MSARRHPPISIIIPVYNGERYLRKTLLSAAAQTYPNLEIVIVDDASQDGSAQIISEFAWETASALALSNETNMGFCKSVNRGVAACRGELFLTLGQDDLLPSNHLEKMLEERRDGFSFIHCNATIIDGSGTPMQPCASDLGEHKGTINYRLAQFNCISSTGLVVNKQRFVEVGGFDERYRNYGEWLLWIRLADRGPVYFCSTTRALYRRHETNLTTEIFGRDVAKDLELRRYFRHCQREALRSRSLHLQARASLRLLFVFRMLARRLRTARRVFQRKWAAPQ
jgi:glycosyltransferase involved in cell wall biosynthesis